jgi:effector-binding domain-containing protein
MDLELFLQIKKRINLSDPAFKEENERITMNRINKLAIIISGISSMTNALMAIDEPDYKILEKSENIEIREYNSYIIAETIVSGDFEEVGNLAFSRLAGYIGGENTQQESIEMTAPVNQEKLETEGQEIKMTAPVSQEAIDSGQYRIAFVMPSQFTLATLPKPKDKRVQLREIPAKKVAVIRYSGTWSKDNYKENESELYAFLNEKGYQIKSDPVWSRYDPPFMPWFLRRNEIMIEIK